MSNDQKSTDADLKKKTSISNTVNSEAPSSRRSSLRATFSNFFSQRQHSWPANRPNSQQVYPYNNCINNSSNNKDKSANNNRMRSSISGLPSGSIPRAPATVINIDTDEYEAGNSRNRRSLSNSISNNNGNTNGQSSDYSPRADAHNAVSRRNNEMGLSDWAVRLVSGSLSRRLQHSPVNFSTLSPQALSSGNPTANYSSTTASTVTTSPVNRYQQNQRFSLDSNTSRALDVIIGAANGGQTDELSTAVSGSSPAQNEDATPSSSGNGENGDNADNHQTGISQLRVLLQSREAICQYICQNFAEFPNLHGFNVSVLAFVVIGILFGQFFVTHFAACIALIFGLMHYQDATRFMRCVSGASDIYFSLASVLLRNIFIIYIFDKRFVFAAAGFQNQISFLDHPNFFSVVYRVVAAELFVMDVTLILKLAFSKNPLISKVYKRRVYQWLEYTSVLYRYPIPLIQWCAFLDSMVWIVIYCIAKLLIGFPIAWTWFRTTVRLFRYSHLGTLPTVDELKHAEQCTICYAEFSTPIKLNCGHVFCSDCIRTWLDREVTCPICRATVSKEDNHYRNGNSIFPMHVF